MYNVSLNEIVNNEDLKDNKEEVIYQYLKSLKGFRYLLKNYNTLELEKILKDISKVIKIQKISKNELIFQQGEKAKDFYIIFNGQLKVLVLRPYEFYMTEEEYIYFLLQSRLHNQIHIINQCLRLNLLVYPISCDNFDDFVKDLSNKESKTGAYTDFKYVVKKAKEIIEKISKEKESPNNDNNNNKIIISPEEYIKMYDISNNVKYNTKIINNFINNNLNHAMENRIKLIMKDRKKVIIPIYEVFSELESGYYFGELSLESSEHLREASIISVKDESFIGYINKKDYALLIHESIDKRKKNIFSVISYFSLYKTINQAFFDKKYLNFFKDKAFHVNSYLFYEGDECDKMYFIIEGEYEISVNKNIIEVNEMIINYKKILKKISKNFKIDEKFLKTDEEMKQNNNLLLSQKFQRETTNKIIMDKKYIKLNILHEKDIIGLCDIFSYNDENESYNKDKDKDNDNDNNYNKPLEIYGEQVIKKSLVNCKCLTYNCNAYCLNNVIFNNLYYNEGNYNLPTKQLEIKKICSIIKRLQAHKKYIFSLVNQEQNKFAKNIKKLKFFTKNPKLRIKGIFDQNLCQNIITNIKTQKEQNEKYNNSKSSDTKKQYKNNFSFTNNKMNKTNIKFDFKKYICPSLTRDRNKKKSTLESKYDFSVKSLKEETILNLYNKNYNDEYQTNMAKLLVSDFLYEKIFYNYTLNDLNANNSDKNLVIGTSYKLQNDDNYSKNDKNSTTNQSSFIQTEYLKTFNSNQRKNNINIQRVRNINRINNYFSKTNHISHDNPSNFKAKLNSLSIDSNNLRLTNNNKLFNTICRTKENVTRLIKPNNKIYDPLAFEKFNNLFHINLRKKFFS